MANETVSLNARDFADGRVILVRSDDAHCAQFWDESQAGYEQSCDGPTHLVIGRRARDEVVTKMALRYGMDIAELMAFRDNAEPVSSQLRERFLPQEAPAFQLLRRCGTVRLWISETPRCQAFDDVRPPAVRYHITEGDELGVHHMADLNDKALPNFELACKELS